MNKKLVAIILTGAVIGAALMPATALAGTSKKAAKSSFPVVVYGWPSSQPQPHNPATPGIVYALGGQIR